MYTPKKTTDYEELVRHCFRQSGGKMLSGPVCLEAKLYLQMPKSLSQKRQRELAYSNCEKKPDIDNVIKIIGDALNGIAYKDDSSIVSVTATKQWAAQGCLVVSLNSAEVKQD
jgi:Holliday junction resolvase RusA-like endonuclease